MATRLVGLVVWGLAFGCSGDKSSDSVPASSTLSTSTGSTTSAGTPTTGVGTTSTGTTTTTTGPTGTLPITVTGFTAGCGAGTLVGPQLSATPGPGAGEVDVLHSNLGPGCCPTMQASAVADYASGRVDVSYNLLGDDCDCVCSLDATYRLQGVPAGPWSVRALTESGGVTVP